jgi:hypothetical protein
MAIGTRVVEPRHGQAAGRFENVAAMRVMALGAIDLFFDQRMVLGQVKLSFNRTMTFKTWGRILARVDDEPGPPAACGDMQAARAMTRFASGFTCRLRILKMNPGVGAAWENAADVGMALGARAVAHETRARNIRSRRHTQRGG